MTLANSQNSIESALCVFFVYRIRVYKVIKHLMNLNTVDLVILSLVELL